MITWKPGHTNVCILHLIAGSRDRGTAALGVSTPIVGHPSPPPPPPRDTWPIFGYGGAAEHVKTSSTLGQTRSPQGLYNWAACDVTNPNLSPLLSFTFQVISGTSQIFRLLSPRDKKRYYATQYFNFSVTLLRYGLKILTDSWIEGDSLGYLDHPPRRCHPGRQPTFIHFFTNTLKCLHGRLAG